MLGRRAIILLFGLFCLYTIAPFSQAPGQSNPSAEEVLKRKFLKARQQMRTTPRSNSEPVAAPTPTPEPVATPTPRQAEPDVQRAEPETRHAEAQVRQATADIRPAQKATPRPTPMERAEPEPTPAPTPTPTPTPQPTPAAINLSSESKTETTESSEAPKANLTVHKSGLQEEEGEVVPPEETEKPKWSLFGGGGKSRYKYLSKSVRAAIDNARVKKNRWKYIVVHNSGTRQGNAKAYDYYHKRVRHMQNGLAYHFVVGNGKGAGVGEIEIGGRWTRQINGGHVASDYLNNIAIGICLTGDFNRDRPSAEQLEALEELINYLRKRVGKVDGKQSIVRAHRQINPKPTDCPGDRFPYDWLARKFR